MTREQRARAEAERIISPTPTPYMVRCRDCGPSFLTEQEYDRQMGRPNRLWQCPRCGDDASWDDENYERRAAHPTGGEVE